MKNKIKIAIIDTGINGIHPYLKDVISANYEFGEGSDNIVKIASNYRCNDQNGHGTACASAIVKECRNIELYSYKLLDATGVGCLKKFEEVLTIILESDIDLINMSLAVTSRANTADLNKLCKALEKQGKIIVAALENHVRKSYPAIYPHCYGVQGFILEELDAIWFNKRKKIQCIVDNTPFFHCDLKNEYKMFGKSNSYASAKLTGMIARIMYQNQTNDRKQINDALQAMAKSLNWNNSDLKASKRFPILDKYKNEGNKYLICEIKKKIKEYLKINKGISLEGKGLFTQEIGLTYEQCFGLLLRLQEYFNFEVSDYTKISREDFYTIYSLERLLQNQLKNGDK